MMKFLLASTVMSIAAAGDCPGSDATALAECLKGAPVVTDPTDNAKVCDLVKWTIWCTVHASGDCTISAEQTEGCKTMVAAMTECDATCNSALALAASPLALAAVFYML